MEQPSPCQPLKVPLETQDNVFTHGTLPGNPSTRIIIQGEAGTGKSTLMVKYVYDWARQDGVVSSPIRKFKLVFLLRMRDLDKSSHLEEAIVKHLLPHDTKITPSQLRTFIEDHPDDCCVILDGYDEFRHSESASAASERSIAQMINNNILRKCLLILSSRPDKLSDLDKHLKEYRQFEVRGFSKDKIKEYISNFFGQEQEILATSLIEYIESNNLIGFAAAPLITRLLCLYWQKGAASRDVKTVKSLFSVSKLHDALFEFLEEHYFSRRSTDDDIDVDKVVLDLGLGKVALKSLWCPNNQLVFPWSEIVKDVDDAAVANACKIGLLHKQQATQSKGHHSKRKSSLSSWKKVTTVEFLHKTVQEKCAGDYLAYLSDIKEKEFDEMMQALKTSTEDDTSLCMRCQCEGGNDDTETFN